MVEIEVMVAVNEDGDWVVCKGDEDAKQLLEDEYGGYCCRTVRVKLKVPAPKVVEVEAEVPDDEPGPVVVKVS